MPILLLGLLGVGAYLLLQNSTCVFSVERLNRWGMAQHLFVVYMLDNSVPTLEGALNVLENSPHTYDFIGWVLVTRDGHFYLYDENGEPYESHELRRSYCESFG
jgi:hypothetical protein